jgi:raffinose/stachyose/melibiose transport system permease protein
MVISKNKSIRNLVLFILPALVFYLAFFGLPFFQGIGFSFMRWDGASQKLPPSFSQERFETEILSQAGPETSEVLLQYYTQQDGRGQYFLQREMSWGEESAVEQAFQEVGWENPNYRFVGLNNYIEIFTNTNPETGDASRALLNFFPRAYEQIYFRETTSLTATSFEEGLFHKLFLSRVSEEERAFALEVFQLDEDQGRYEVRSEWKQGNLTGSAEGLRPLLGEDFAQRGEISEILIDFGKTKDQAGMAEYLSGVEWFTRLEGDESLRAQEIAQRFYRIGEMKVLLADNMKEDRLNMGVLVFTIFFTVFNVIFTNIAAFFLALALDQKLRTKNALRSVFFLPNILALVVVAFIWNLVFDYLLGPMFGVTQWMSDTNKAPWLVVLVSVWQGAGYLMVIYLAGMQSIPGEVMEAAAVDGASGWRKVWNIILPLLMPAFTICLFLSISNSLKAFDLIYVLNGGPTGYNYGTVPFVMDIYQDFAANDRAGMASAKAILLMIVILSVTGLQLNVMKKKEVEY